MELIHRASHDSGVLVSIGSQAEVAVAAGCCPALVVALRSGEAAAELEHQLPALDSYYWENARLPGSHLKPFPLKMMAHGRCKELNID